MAQANGYAGDVGPEAAWEMLSRDPRAVLIDVRTDAEWAYVGLPDLRALDKGPLLISWKLFPDMAVNARFTDQVAAADVGHGDPVLLLCRSGQRSAAAAAALTAAGFARCYNVAEGFEGDKDAEGHRSRLGGWKARGLPWIQD